MPLLEAAAVPSEPSSTKECVARWLERGNLSQIGAAVPQVAFGMVKSTGLPPDRGQSSRRVQDPDQLHRPVPVETGGSSASDPNFYTLNCEEPI